jgi:hypothetical protein
MCVYVCGWSKSCVLTPLNVLLRVLQVVCARLQSLVDDHESIPYERKSYLKQAVLRQVSPTTHTRYSIVAISVYDLYLVPISGYLGKVCNV